MTTAKIEIEKARTLLTAVGGFPPRDLMAILEQQQRALEAINARLEQHFVGAQYDHPEMEMKR